jgi:predicted nucleic acid-binding protein
LTGWLLDTNVVSEIRRPRPSLKVLEFLQAQPIETLHISVVSFAEIRFGIELAPDANQRTQLTEWLDRKLRPMFERRTLPVSEDVIVRWRLLVEQGRKRRVTYAQPDLFIAATALHHGLTVVTRDAAEFERAGAKVANPWA